MKIDDDKIKEFEIAYTDKIEESKPKYCPNCGKKGLDVVILYDVKPDEVTVIYDCYCEKCGWSGDISPDSVANIEFKTLKERTDDDVCCVCGHPLSVHIDEGNGWRCHFLGPDGYQCECFLRKKRTHNDISYYSLRKRIEQFKKELEEEMKMFIEDKGP